MKRGVLWIGLLLAGAGAAIISYRALRPDQKVRSAPPASVLDAPSPSAIWPWPASAISHPHRGVTRWYDASPADGTTLELFRFDFAENPRLRLELYDQDEDDESPGDDMANYDPRGVGAITRHLNERGTGPVVAAWNGSFFAYDFRHGRTARGVARHVGPVVLRGHLAYNVGNPRWTFGVLQTKAGPKFDVLHQPPRAIAEKEFTFASAGAQCLINKGRLLRLQPYPQPGDPPVKQPVPSTSDDVGHIPLVDHMRTSRTSMAWSKDNRRFYLLIVNEPDHELPSKLAVKRGEPSLGGWTVADLQRFWHRFGAWSAVNIDGGAMTQMVYLRADGKYEMLPPRLVESNRRMVFSPDFPNAPAGGTLMTFYVRDTAD